MSETSNLVAQLGARCGHLRDQAGKRRTSDRHLRKLLDIYAEGWQEAERQRDRQATELDVLRKSESDWKGLAEDRFDHLLAAEKQLHDALNKVADTQLVVERLRRQVEALEEEVARLKRDCTELVPVAALEGEHPF